MIRIRTGNRWKGERKLRGAAVAEEAWDAVGIEVDGVDISCGLLEGKLVLTLSALVDAAQDLASGRRRATQLGFPSGVVLLLARRGGAVLLSLVRLVRPSQVLVQDVEVELADFARAVAASAHELLQGIAARYARAGLDPRLQALAKKAERLDRMVVDGLADGPEADEIAHLRRSPAPGERLALVFDVRDDDGRIATDGDGEDLGALLLRGRLALLGAGGEELAAADGVPFLVLRDLVGTAARLVTPGGDSTVDLPLGAPGPILRYDLRTESLDVGGRSLRADRRDLARTILACARDFAAQLAAWTPWLRDNPYLTDLREEAVAHLRLLEERETANASAPAPARPPRRGKLGAPPAVGELRTVSLRVRWRAELPAIRRLVGSGERAWIAHVGGVASLALRDGARTDHDGAVGAAAPERKGPVLVLEEGGTLLALGEAGTPLLWKVETGWAQVESRYLCHRADAWMLVDQSSLVCVDLRTGAQRFRLDPPAAHRAAIAASGPFLALAADNGMVYAVDLDRREVAWRLPLPLGPLAVVAEGVVGIADGRQGLEAVGILAGDRRILFRTPLPVDAVGRLVAQRRGVLISAAGETGGEILGLDAAGALRYRVRPVLGPGAPAVAVAGQTVFARGPHGVARIERGRVRWSAPAAPGGAPRIVRGMIALPGERLSLCDAATGRELLSPAARERLPAADHVAVGPEGEILVADIHGSCAGLHVAGALAVVEPLRAPRSR
ncbi:MAG TPA: hypothetical protein VKY51_01590 [Fredinandcohnia sp.]|nr:hypothetical protein [Fredinandcohnia sp.]